MRQTWFQREVSTLTGFRECRHHPWEPSKCLQIVLCSIIWTGYSRQMVSVCPKAEQLRESHPVKEWVSWGTKGRPELGAMRLRLYTKENATPAISWRKFRPRWSRAGEEGQAMSEHWPERNMEKLLQFKPSWCIWIQIYKNGSGLCSSCPSHLVVSMFTADGNWCSITHGTLSLEQNFKICMSNLKKWLALMKPIFKSLKQGFARFSKPSVFNAYLPSCLPQPVCCFNNLQRDFTCLIMQNHCFCIHSATCLTNLNSQHLFWGSS